ncbi:ankyrin [Daldinia eschscholtzii]|nr:ankyrin [Daldinia eschscholtzii]
MARLTDLPVELLENIANCKAPTHSRHHIRPILDGYDLYNLMFTSRGFYRVFNRLLYTYSLKYRWNHVFFEAAQSGNLIALKQAVSFKLEPDRWSRRYSWADLLNLACEHGHKDVVAWLLDRGTPLEERDWRDSCAKINLKGCYQLVLAFVGRSDDTAILLLSRGANPQFTTESGTSRSALHYAVTYNMVRLVEYVVAETGLSVDIKDYKGFTPLRHMIRYSKTPDTDTKMINKLIELGANVNSEARGELPLTSALMRGKYRHAAILLEAGSKVKPDCPMRKVKSPLQALICGTRGRDSKDVEQQDMLRRMMDAGAELPEKVDRGKTPLEEAFLSGSSTFASHLFHLYKEKYPEAVDATVLQRFMVQNYKRVKIFPKKMEMLLKDGARMDVPLFNGRTYLQWIIDKYSEGSRYFLQKFGRNYLKNLLSVATESMLDWKYLNSILLEVCTTKVDDCFIENLDGFIQVLTSYGAVFENPNDIYPIALSLVRTSYGPCTPSLIPMFNSSIPEEKLPDLLTEALEARRPWWFQYLIGRIGPNFDSSRRNPRWLHQAVEWGNEDVVKRLLSGVSALDVNDLSVNGVSPLAHAAKKPWQDTWMPLLDHGADPFLSAKHPVCAGLSGDNASNRIDPSILCNVPGVSAFEVMLHTYPFYVETLWKSSAARERPDPRTFIPCIGCTGGVACHDHGWIKSYLVQISVEEYYSDWVALLEQTNVEDDATI